MRHPLADLINSMADSTATLTIASVRLRMLSFAMHADVLHCRYLPPSIDINGRHQQTNSNEACL